jgi:hypothetical protein
MLFPVSATKRQRRRFVAKRVLENVTKAQCCTFNGSGVTHVLVRWGVIFPPYSPDEG